MKTSSLTEKFQNKGLVIENSKKFKDIKKIKKKIIGDFFYKFGILYFKNFKIYHSIGLP